MDEVSQLPSEAHMHSNSSLRDKEFKTQTLQSVCQVHVYYLKTRACVFFPSNSSLISKQCFLVEVPLHMPTGKRLCELSKSSHK